MAKGSSLLLLFVALARGEPKLNNRLFDMVIRNSSLSTICLFPFSPFSCPMALSCNRRCPISTGLRQWRWFARTKDRRLRCVYRWRPCLVTSAVPFPGMSCRWVGSHHHWIRWVVVWTNCCFALQFILFLHLLRFRLCWLSVCCWVILFLLI